MINSNNTNTGRIEFIDLAKGFCILFVVMQHVSNYYDVHFYLNEKLTAFRMPLYYFLSGVFFKNYGGTILIKKKVNKLLIPFLFWYLVMYLINKSGGGHSFICSLLSGNITHVLVGLVPSVYDESFPTAVWFLFSLFQVNIIFYLCFCASNLTRFIVNNKSFDSLVLMILSSIIGITGLLLSYLQINLPLFVDTSLTALPFFMAGFIIKKKTSFFSPNKLDKYSLIIILLCFAVICLFSDGIISFYKNRYSLCSLITLYPCGIIGTIGILYCAKCLTHIPFVNYIGRYSIIILVTHGLVFPRLEPIVSLLVESNGGKFVLCFFLTMLCCFFLIPVVRRLLPYVTAQKDVFK